MVTKEGRSLSWENLNRAKKSVALDLRSNEGRDLCIEIAKQTRQCITNLPERSFLSHAALSEDCKDMVSLRIMGWHDGQQAMDFTVNAASGYPLMCGARGLGSNHCSTGKPGSASMGFHNRGLLCFRFASRYPSQRPVRRRSRDPRTSRGCSHRDDG